MFIKQHSETVMVWNYQNADCRIKINLLCHLWLFILLGFRNTNDVSSSDSKDIPHAYADRWVSLPACGFLLVFYSSDMSKTHHFWVTAWDRQKRTDWRTRTAAWRGGVYVMNEWILLNEYFIHRHGYVLLCGAREVYWVTSVGGLCVFGVGTVPARHVW